MSEANFDLSKIIKENPELTSRQKINYVWKLSVPGILAQISSILMQYIDAAMVGSLGAEASAAIGLVASSTWIFGSLSNALSIGFTVQASHAVGAGLQEKARHVLFHSIHTCLIFSIILAGIGAAISRPLPVWLGAEPSIRRDAALYFLVFALSAPFYQLVYLMSGMLQASGNMRLPGILNALMCIMDAAFNVIFIKVFKLGVFGAALGSWCSAFVTAVIITVYTVCFSDYLNLRGYKISSVNGDSVFKAVKLGFPVAVEQVAFTGALVVVTRIIAPLGAVALSANSFAVTAEALCYMPGYGIQEASTTLVGQSTGASRPDLQRSFSWITVQSGALVMGIMGVIMWILCPFVFRLLTPVPEIQELAVKVLRIELFAEPFYGAAIVSIGALRGKGDTLVPSILMLISLWIVRLGLSLWLVHPLGLVGIWLAMAIELTFRGIVMTIRMAVMNRKSPKNTVAAVQDKENE